MTLDEVYALIHDCDSVSMIVDKFKALGWTSEVVWESWEDVGFSLTKPGEKELLITNDHYINRLNIGFIGDTDALSFGGTYPHLLGKMY